MTVRYESEWVSDNRRNMHPLHLPVRPDLPEGRSGLPWQVWSKCRKAKESRMQENKGTFVTNPKLCSPWRSCGCWVDCASWLIGIGLWWGALARTSVCSVAHSVCDRSTLHADQSCLTSVDIPTNRKYHLQLCNPSSCSRSP
jgi:hypothetical protein